MGDTENRRRVERVRMMAEGSSKWDLSPNDLDALRYVLFEREELRHEVAILRRMLTQAFDEYIGNGDEPVSLDTSFKALKDYDDARRASLSEGSGE